MKCSQVEIVVSPLSSSCKLALLLQIFYISRKGEKKRKEQSKIIGKKRFRTEIAEGVLGLALTTGMHEETASIPQASGWFQDTTERAAQQPTCESCWPSPPSAILGLSATMVAFTQQPHK